MAHWPAGAALGCVASEGDARLSVADKPSSVNSTCRSCLLDAILDGVI